MHEITRIERLGRAKAEPIEKAKAEAERARLQSEFESARREVEAVLRAKLPELPSDHRAMVEAILNFRKL